MRDRHSTGSRVGIRSSEVMGRLVVQVMLRPEMVPIGSGSGEGGIEQRG